MFLTHYLRKRIKNGKLLDVGCGVGYFLIRAEKYYETYGIDISHFAISYAKRNLNKSILKLGSATNIPFSDEIFDIVTCFDVLEHIRNPREVLREIYRVLKPSGVLIVRVPNTESVGLNLKKDDWYGFRDETHVSLFSNDEWIKLVEDESFEIIDVFYDGLWDTPYFRRVPKILQDILIKIPSLVLFELGVRFPKRLGENLHIVAIKKVKKP